MTLSFAEIQYEGAFTCVTWRGISLTPGEDLSAFLQTEMATRLHDIPGRDEFQQHLQGLALTGMGSASLAAVLNAQSCEERDWAAGEALAEAWLIRCHQVQFPWNMERDKRNAKGSLPGADMVGFLPCEAGFRLMIGEVKTSGEDQNPPQVMSGRGGLIHQIDELGNNLEKIGQLLFWLHARVKNTAYQTAYDDAAKLYFNSGNKCVALFGILIRDTSPNCKDLENRAKTLDAKLAQPTRCELIALHLPFEIADLPAFAVAHGGVS